MPFSHLPELPVESAGGKKKKEEEEEEEEEKGERHTGWVKRYQIYMWWGSLEGMWDALKNLGQFSNCVGIRLFMLVFSSNWKEQFLVSPGEKCLGSAKSYNHFSPTKQY